MKNLVQKQKMRVAGLCLAIGMSAAVNAQTAVGSDVTKNSAKTNVASNTAAVRVVDNKGTIKYLQANNGLTQIVNTTADVTTTTWQLGGSLTDNTYIDANGKVFALDGLTLASGSESTDAVSGSKNGDGGTATGFTLLVRDEATGEVKKLLVSDLIKGGQTIVPVTTAATDVTYSNTALSSDINKISVYRNGIKLVVTDNYTLDTTTTPGTPALTILGTVGTAAAGATPESDDYYALAASDKIEVQWIK
jgi:hypothetical protein